MQQNRVRIRMCISLGLWYFSTTAFGKSLRHLRLDDDDGHYHNVMITQSSLVHDGTLTYNTL